MPLYAKKQKAEPTLRNDQPGPVSESAHFPRGNNSLQHAGTWRSLPSGQSQGIIASFFPKNKGVLNNIIVFQRGLTNCGKCAISVLVRLVH